MPGVRFSVEQKAKAVRLVVEATPQPESQRAAITSVAAKIGASAETVRKWGRRAEVDSGARPGLSGEEHAEIKPADPCTTVLCGQSVNGSVNEA